MLIFFIKKGVFLVALGVLLIPLTVGVANVGAAEASGSGENKPTEESPGNFVTKNLATFAGKSGYETTGVMTPAEYVGRVLSGVYALLGVVALILVIYGGFEWMFAAGNQEKISSAQKIIVSAVIGLAIIVGAYVITDFVVTVLANQ